MTTTKAQQIATRIAETKQAYYAGRISDRKHDAVIASTWVEVILAGPEVEAEVRRLLGI